MYQQFSVYLDLIPLYPVLQYLIPYMLSYTQIQPLQKLLLSASLPCAPCFGIHCFQAAAYRQYKDVQVPLNSGFLTPESIPNHKEPTVHSHS